LLDLAQLAPEAQADLGVEGGERLVEEEDLGLTGEGARQGHALLLAARELVGVAGLQAGQACQRHHLGDPLAQAPLRPARHAQAEGDVLPHRHGGEEGVRLEDDAHTPAPRGHAVDHVFVEEDLAGVGNLEAGDHP
jgi:hypothetical protein